MVAVAIGTAVAGVVGAGASIIEGNKAANAQKSAAQSQINETQREFNIEQANYAPWLNTGRSALSVLAGQYGLNPAGSTSPNTPGNYGAFTSSPGYQWQLNQGLQAIDRQNSARGLLNSGAADKARMTYAEGLASQDYGNWWNRLAGLAGTGQTAAAQTAQAGQASVGQINNALQQQGNATASSYLNTGSAINSGINNVLSAYLFSRGGGFGAPSMGYYPGYGNA